MDDDPAAIFRFFKLLREDAEKKEKNQILYHLIEEELGEEDDMYDMIFKASTEKNLKNELEDFVDLLLSKKQIRLAAEELIQTDDLLSAKFAAHLAQELGKEKNVDTGVDMEQILKDLQTGDVLKKPEKVKNAVLALLGDKVEKLYLAAANAGGSTGGFDINDLLGGNTAVQQIQPEIRYFLTVSMSYDESLIQAELLRKGLDFSAKVDGPVSPEYVPAAAAPAAQDNVQEVSQ